MKCIFLYNPESGRGKIRKKIPLIQTHLKRVYDEVIVCETHSAEDFMRKVNTAADVFDAIIFSGGDGTFQNVLKALNGRKVALGYLPSGTVNDVARSLGIPRKLKGALKVIEHGALRDVDCLKAGDGYAMYLVAAGAFTSCSYSTPRRAKKKFGSLAYALYGLKHNMHFEVFSVSVECGGEKKETPAVLVFVLNGRSVAGFLTNKKASMTDGLLEVAVIKQAKKPNFFQRIGAYFSVAGLLLFGTERRRKNIVFLRGEKVTIQTEEGVVWDYDGEKGASGNLEAEILRGGVRIFVPKNKKI